MKIFHGARAVRRWTGRFVDPALERAFHEEHFELSARGFTRYSLGVCALGMLAYGVHDALVVPEIRAAAWALRFGFFGPVGAAVLAFTFARAYARHHLLAALLFGLACNATVLSIAALAPPDGYFLYASYAVLITVMGPFIGRLDVRTEVAFTVLTVALYNALDRAAVHARPVVCASFNGTFLAMGTIGALVARQQELQAREAFLQRGEIRAQALALAAARARAEALLLNVLPAPVAARLEANERPIADGVADVTVVFGDLVGFTELSARLSPAEVVRRLDEFFSACDALAARVGLEKIKTIGDAYMAVGGLDGRSAGDHPRRAVEFALGMLDAVRAFNERSGERLAVRVGVHTGPVVAGVIGTSKFSYDVWGDTVNVASRMESHGIAGVVQVSEATWTRVRDHFVFEARGDIAVKGRGTMKTFTTRRAD